MDQTSGTNPTDAPPAQSPQESLPVEQPAEARPGFRSRGQARRRARFLRRARELAYRDLGGLVFNLHRFGQRNDALVLAKLGTLSHIDRELRAIETALREQRPVTVLREAGITACPRCAAIHGSEDRYCPNCGLPMSRHADLPVAGAPAGDAAAAPPAAPVPPVSPAGPPAAGGVWPPAASGEQDGASVALGAAAPGAESTSAASEAAQAAATPVSQGSWAEPSADGTHEQPQAPGQAPSPGAPAETAKETEPQAPLRASSDGEGPPATAQHTPATAQHTPAAGAGRSPVPPFGRQGERETSPPSTSGPEEQTEIIRPQAPGS